MLIAKKSLGQNFLLDKNIANKIVKLTKIYNENIIEIGPGTGVLTEIILDLKPKKLILIEKDKKLYEFLSHKFKNNKLVYIFNNDALKFHFDKFKKPKIISNLPYNISSKFLTKNIIFNNNITEIICMIQKEMAIKFDYNLKKMNKYKFLIEHLCIYNRHFDVSPKVFFPKPKVYSEVVSFKFKDIIINKNKLDYFINNFFIHKRKKLSSNKIINAKLINKYNKLRYEDLIYDQILEIYQGFNFSRS